MSYVPSTAVVALDSLAETGGQSLNFIWWIAGILVLAGVVIAFAAAASKRKRAAAESAEPAAAEPVEPAVGAESGAESVVAAAEPAEPVAAEPGAAEPASEDSAPAGDADPASEEESPDESK